MRPGKWLAILFLLIPVAASADVTTGGVNFRDPLGYTKPAFYPLTLPTPGVNQYWVNLASGSGSACTSVAPCALSTVSGKAGTHGDGGGAYIYIKGTGGVGSPVLYGTAGNEVVIRPWDDATDATITGAHEWTSNRHQYVVWDGGPNLRIRFIFTSTDNFDQSIMFQNTTVGQHAHVTFYRTDWEVTGQGEHIAVWGSITDFDFINNEFHSENSSSIVQHHIYLSGADPANPASARVRFLNNIFRDSGGEAIEFRLFATWTDITIDGNAFHDVGKQICADAFKCRSAVTFANDSGTFAGTWRVANNLIWDTGEGCLRTWSNPSTTQIYNNTCYNWGAGASGNGHFTDAAFADFGFTSNPPGDFRNNIIYATGNAPDGDAKTPFPNNASVDSFNACISGKSCGSSPQTISSASFLSLNENSADFLKLVTAATPIDHGTTLCAATTDYFGTARPVNSTCDIGAQEFCAGGCTVDTTFSTGNGRIIIKPKGQD